MKEEMGGGGRATGYRRRGYQEGIYPPSLEVVSARCCA